MSAGRVLLAIGFFAVPSFGATNLTAGPTASPALDVVGALEIPEVPALPVAVEPVAASWDDVELGGADRTVFALALGAAEKAIAGGEATNPGTLTVIDFSRPSTEKRLWVYDLRARRVLFHEHVAHGRNSGGNVPDAFSNIPESYQTSLGLYRTAESYIGKHGYSLRLEGLERGVNDRARERAIVIHGAEYVNATTAQAQGRLGRSLGCPAVRPEIATPLIDAVKEGGLLFAYYPEQTWLETSSYLN